MKAGRVIEASSVAPWSWPHQLGGGPHFNEARAAEHGDRCTVPARRLGPRSTANVNVTDPYRTRRALCVCRVPIRKRASETT